MAYKAYNFRYIINVHLKMNWSHIYAFPFCKHGCYIMFIFAILMLLSTIHIIGRLQYHIQPQSEEGHKNELHRDEINRKLPDESIMQHQ